MTAYAHFLCAKFDLILMHSLRHFATAGGGRGGVTFMQAFNYPDASSSVVNKKHDMVKRASGSLVV